MQRIISFDPNIIYGTPVFMGTRVPARNLIEHLEAGKTIDEFIENFSSVNEEQILAF